MYICEPQRRRNRIYSGQRDLFQGETLSPRRASTHTHTHTRLFEWITWKDLTFRLEIKPKLEASMHFCTLNLFITKPARSQAIKSDLPSTGVTTAHFDCLFTHLLHNFWQETIMNKILQLFTQPKIQFVLLLIGFTYSSSNSNEFPLISSGT